MLVRHSLLVFSITFLAGLAIRLAFLPFLGTTDHQIWKIWSYAGATHPLTQVYRLRDDATPDLTFDNIRFALEGRFRPAKWTFHHVSDYEDYPPVLPVSLGLLGRIYHNFSPVFKDNGVLNGLVKLPGLLADAVATILVFVVARRWRDPRTALLASGLYWLNPMALVGGALLAYQDPVYAAPLILCACLLAGGRQAAGWASYGLALVIKPQPLIVAPVLLVVGLARRSASRLVGYVASAGAVDFAAVLPYILGGTFINLLANNLRNAGETYLSAYNCNFWWFASYGREVRHALGSGKDLAGALHVQAQIVHMPNLIAEGLPDPRPWALGFFAAFTVFLLVTWWWRFGTTSQAKNGRAPAAGEAMALQLYAGTLLLTQAHENHAYGAAALLVGIWWIPQMRGAKPDRELLAIACALSAIVLANMVLFYGLGQDIGPNAVPRDMLWLDLSVIVTIANIGVFGWWIWRWIRDIPALGRGRSRVQATG